MTLYEFNALSAKEKEIAAMNGEFLADRREADHTVCLYSVGDFFVEVWYDQVQNEISMLTSFKSQHRLEPYLGRIKMNLSF